MGCCQSNLSSPPKPIPKHLFVDKIKQSQSSGLMSLGQQSKLIKKPSLSQESYQYSVHDIKNEQSQVSRVSILNQQKKNHFKRTNHKQNLHVEIHPEVIQNQELREKLLLEKKNRITIMKQTESKTNDIQRKSESKEQDNGQSNGTLEYFQWEDEGRLSRIDVLRQITNIDKTESYECQQYLTGKDKISFESRNLLVLKSKQQLESLKKLQTIKQNTEQGNQLLWRQNTSSYNQTDRELFQLHGELQTMIVKWERSIGKTKRLKLEQMNRQGHNLSKEDDNLTGKVENNKKTQEKRENDEDEQLMEIWKQNNQQQEKPLQPKQQHQSQNRYQQLKRDYILNPSKTPSPPKLQDFKLDLNKVKDRKQKNSTQSKKKANQKDQQNEESIQDDEQYSKCLLTNPTRILDLSLDQHWVWEKQTFYQTAKNLQKWTEQHRKALPIQDQNIGFIMDKINFADVQISSQLLTYQISMLCCLMSIIKGYFELDKVNLIAYKHQTKNDSIGRKSQIGGFRIFYNGLKRLFPFQEQLSQNDYTQSHQDKFIIQNLFRIYLSLSTPNNKKNPAQLVYNLTGWIPEYIIIEEISSFDGVFERINSNFVEGNTIVTFTSTRNQCYGLKSINIKLKLIHVYDFNSCSKENSQKQSFVTTYKWQEFVQTISSINVNWNPLIYDYIFKTENLFLNPPQLQSYDLIQELDQSSLALNSRQYRLKIPPSQQDIQLRVFLQVHYTDELHTLKQNEGPLTIDLYDYTGTRIHSTIDPIRTINKKHYVYSDVLIFEASKQKTEYVLLVRLNSQNHNKSPDCPIKYTLSTYSFVEVALSWIPLQSIIQQKSINTYLQQSHCGHGINSPHFLNNFYLQLKIPPLEKLKIFVKMPTNESQFELNLIANPDKEPNLTRLNLENILGDIITSEQFDDGKGYLQIQTKHEEYFLMITNHTKCKGQFQIVVQIVQDMSKTLNPQNLKRLYQPKSNQQSSKQQLIFYKQKFFYQEPSLTREVKWIPTHTGPRKRLKSNTHSGYQPFTNFKQFFKNPYVDYSVSSTKKLQFSIHSQTYRKFFDELQEVEQKRDAEPPTLSMSILKVKSPKDCSQKNISNQTLFKIVLDDAFYVPFGFGFWTKVLQIQQGQYRIVFPKMQKQSSIGAFNIYQIEA